MTPALASYNILQALVAPVALPAGAIYLLSREKYRVQFAERIFGWRKCAPQMDRPPVWFHALSFGEVNAAVPLVEATVDRWPDLPVICSAGTASGFAALEKRLSGIVECITFLPYDLYPLCVMAYRAVAPGCFVLIETDVWPNWLWYLRKQGTRLLFVNASISSSAASRLKKMPSVAHMLYGAFDLIAAQSNDDLERFRQCCGDGARLEMGGNLKFDVSCPHEKERLNSSSRYMLGFGEDDTVIVAGSTHAGEEDVLCRAFAALSQRLPDLALRFVVAPRDPARGQAVKALLEKRGLDVLLRSEMTHDFSSHGHDAVVLDTLGELASCYAAATLAFVGGSLVPVGGHNLLEPAVFGVHVLFGPFVESCRDVARAVSECGGGFCVTSCEDFLSVAERLLTDTSFMEKASASVKKLVDDSRGVVKYYLDIIHEAVVNHAA
jgi:3-deoxy-D-manno-octulosonic-acid transferase